MSNAIPLAPLTEDVMNYLNEQERMDFRALAQELEKERIWGDQVQRAVNPAFAASLKAAGNKEGVIQHALVIGDIRACSEGSVVLLPSAGAWVIDVRNVGRDTVESVPRKELQ
jgi:hypothetical protein